MEGIEGGKKTRDEPRRESKGRDDKLKLKSVWVLGFNRVAWMWQRILYASVVKKEARRSVRCHFHLAKLTLLIFHADRATAALL